MRPSLLTIALGLTLLLPACGTGKARSRPAKQDTPAASTPDREPQGASDRTPESTPEQLAMWRMQLQPWAAGDSVVTASSVAETIEYIDAMLERYTEVSAKITQVGEHEVQVLVPVGSGMPSVPSEFWFHEEFWLVDTSAEAPIPFGDYVLLSETDAPSFALGGGGKPHYITPDRILITGRDIIGITAAKNEAAGSWQVHLTFNEDAAASFSDFTTHHVGQPFSMALDRIVMASPMIQSAIPSGAAVLTADYTQTDAETLVARIDKARAPLRWTVTKVDVQDARPGKR